jgi:hypothetical protein
MSGVGMDGVGLGEKINIAVFINLPSANVNTPRSVPQCAGELSGIYDGSHKTDNPA